MILVTYYSMMMVATRTVCMYNKQVRHHTYFVHTVHIMKYALELQRYGAPNGHTDTSAARLVLNA